MKRHPDHGNFVTATFLETHQGSWILDSFDEMLRGFLESTLAEFPSTTIILMSDHGIHYGPEFDRDFGRIHSRLPLFYPIIPNSMNPSYLKHLKANSEKLASHYDFHETIRNLLDLEGYQRNETAVGMSLIESEIPERSCEQVGIPFEFCLCFY